MLKHPIKTVKYAISQNLQRVLAFNLWVPLVVKKCEHIILLAKKWSAHYLKNTHKFGVRLLKSLDEAYSLDAENENFLWTKAISKYMTDVNVDFKALGGGEEMHIGYAYV